MTSDKIEAFPLCWPTGRPRAKSQERSRFDTSQNTAQSSLLWELDLLGARNVVISTNIALRLDGLPYSNRRAPVDKGVAVYFSNQGDQVCFACDRWDKIGDNMQAIRKTVEALRGIARWGTGDMMKAAFTGFTALPAPITNDWRRALGLSGQPTKKEAETAFKLLAREAHPDAGGSTHEMAKLNAAIKEARQALED
ncbi:MAG: hypothetical protein V7727_02075 [Sneathiella sp.]